MSISAVQAAIYAALSGDTALNNLVTDIADVSTAQGQQYPYITFDTQSAEDSGTKTDEHLEIDFYIDVWDKRDAGRAGVFAIQDRVREILHDANLVAASGSIVLILEEYREAIVDPDGVTIHGIQRFNIHYSY